MRERTALLRQGDEVGLLPPVSGGSAEGSGDQAGTEVRIVRERIDTEAVAGRLKRPEDGAAVIFEGVVRDNTRGRRTLYLDYEAYEAMALKQMESLAVEARAALCGAGSVDRPPAGAAGDWRDERVDRGGCSPPGRGV